MKLRSTILSLVTLLIASVGCQSQQTIFNVPSSDVLDKGQVYAELDVSYQYRPGMGNFVPRTVIGAGNSVELGVNLSTFSVPNSSTLSVVPTVKWKFLQRWSWLVGFRRRSRFLSHLQPNI